MVYDNIWSVTTKYARMLILNKTPSKKKKKKKKKIFPGDVERSPVERTIVYRIEKTQALGKMAYILFPRENEACDVSIGVQLFSVCVSFPLMSLMGGVG